MWPIGWPSRISSSLLRLICLRVVSTTAPLARGPRSTRRVATASTDTAGRAPPSSSTTLGLLLTTAKLHLSTYMLCSGIVNVGLSMCQIWPQRTSSREVNAPESYRPSVGRRRWALRSMHAIELWVCTWSSGRWGIGRLRRRRSMLRHPTTLLDYPSQHFSEILRSLRGYLVC